MKSNPSNTDGRGQPFYFNIEGEVVVLLESHVNRYFNKKQPLNSWKMDFHQAFRVHCLFESCLSA